jgi:hypothetical protein
MKLVTKRVKYVKDDYDINCISRADYNSMKTIAGIRNILKDPEWASPYEVVVSTYSYSIEDWAEMELFKYYFTFLFATNILTPIQRYLRGKGVDMAEFSRSLFKEFLITIPTIQKLYSTFVQNVKGNEPIDIYYADLGGNLPYISHYSTLKFLILLNPDGFFKSLEQWLTIKYGQDEHFKIMCEHLSDNIMTPMKSDIPQNQKIKEILSMCKYWGGNLFLNDFASKY